MDPIELARGIATDHWPTWLLVGALVYFVSSLVLDLSRSPIHRRMAPKFLTTGVMLQTSALVVLLIAFLRSDLSIEYVFTYTSADYPWWYRVAGLWGGQKGTLLMWAAFTGLLTLAFLRKTRDAERAHEVPAAPNTVAAIRRTLLVLLSLLTLSTLVARTFSTTPDYLLALKPDGNGLQPVLLTPFMIIHPPLQFIAYALTGLLWAGALAHYATGERDWAALIRPWARLQWMIATLGLGLGGLWAYYVLNFGGFWAWDPVETANLIAWFPTTLLLHSLLGYRRGEYTTAAPLYALLTLPLALFATVATRTGLWVSVHAFTDPSKNFARDPLQRLLNILETSPLLAFLAALTVVAVLLGLLAVLVGRSRGRPQLTAIATAALLTACAFFLLSPVAAFGAIFQVSYWIMLPLAGIIEPDATWGLLVLVFASASTLLLTSKATDPPRERNMQRRLLSYGVVALSLAFLVTLLLQLLAVDGMPREQFDDRAPIVALPILGLLSAHFLTPHLGTRPALLTSAGALLTGAICASIWKPHWHVLVVLPLLVLVFVAASLRMRAAAAAGANTPPRQRTAATLLLIGAIGAFVLWGNPPTHIDFRLFALSPQWSWALIAYPIAGFAALVGLVHLGTPVPRTARVAALLLLPMLGVYGASTLAATASLVLLRTSSRQLEPFKAALDRRRGQLRTASIYGIHIALAIGLTGYAFATYESAESGPLTASASSPAEHGGYALELLESRAVGISREQGIPSEIHVDMAVLKEGVRIETATLVYWLVEDGTAGHYDARVTVIRRGLEDVYVYPAALLLANGERMDDHVKEVVPRGDEVVGVELTMKTLPAVGLVWTGLWTLTIAMGAQLLLGAWRIGVPVPVTVSPGQPEPVGTLTAK